MLQTSKILGILNITTDSFSDGGDYLNAADAVRHAERMWKDGAAMIDVGAASSNVNSSNVDPQTEITRLNAVLPQLKAKGIAVSVDTYNMEVQRWCLASGFVDCINDIQGFPFPEIYPELAKSNVKLVIMHSVQREGHATEVETEAVSVFNSMIDFFHKRIDALTSAGVERERIILDPGMGNFLGSNPEASIYVLRHIQQIKSEFSLPIMIGVSRKSFLAKVSDCDADLSIPISERRAAATLAAELYAANSGADWLRTHDVRAIRTALETDLTLRQQAFCLS